MRPYAAKNGAAGIHQHHWSYRPEHMKDTIPLCRSCHRRVHTGVIPEPRTGRVYTTVPVPRPAIVLTMPFAWRIDLVSCD